VEAFQSTIKAARRTSVANMLGSIGLASSLGLWPLLFGFGRLVHFEREPAMQLLDAFFLLWVWIWPAGFVLTAVAAILGSKRWWFAVLAPIFSFWVSGSILAGIPF
jgi:hypothetical protein